MKISPDKKHFLSMGWSWGSSDSYNIYEIEHFINKKDILDIKIGNWEHLDRAACWINEHLIAFGYNPFAEDDNNVNYALGSEIHFCDINEMQVENKKISSEGIDAISAKMEFCHLLNSLIIISKHMGISIVSLNGVILFQDNDVKINDYSAALNLFISFSDHKILISKFTT